MTDSGFDPIPVKTPQDETLLVRSGPQPHPGKKVLFEGASDEGWYANIEATGAPTGPNFYTLGPAYLNSFGPQSLSTTYPNWPLNEDYADEGWLIEKGWFAYGGYHDIYMTGRMTVQTASMSATQGGATVAIQLEPDSDVKSLYANVSSATGNLARREAFTSGVNKAGVIRRVGRDKSWVQFYDTGTTPVTSGDVLTGAGGGTLTLSSSPITGNLKAYQLLLPVRPFNTFKNRFFELSIKWVSHGRFSHVLLGRLVVHGSDNGNHLFTVDDNALNSGNGFALRSGYFESFATSSTSENDNQWDFYKEDHPVSMRFAISGTKGDDNVTNANWMRVNSILATRNDRDD